MQTATKPQIAKIHVLLGQLGELDRKAEIVLNCSNGRTESTKQLTMEEARQLISSLSEYDPRERQKSLIFSLAYQAGIIYGTTADDKRMNTAKLNMFLREKGAVKKDLKDMTYTELSTIHRQFEAILKATKNSASNKEAGAAVKQLLGELNLAIV